VSTSSRVGGFGNGSAPSVSDKTAEDGFQRALDRSVVAPERVPLVKPGPQPGSRAPLRQALPLPAPGQTLPQAKAPPPKGPPAKSEVNIQGRSERGPVNAEKETGRFSSLGDRLVEMRRNLGVTQVELAKRMGSTQPAMARLEKGEMKPNLRTLARYGEAIGQRVQVAFDKGEAVEGRDAPLERCTIEAVPETLGQVRRTLGVTQAQVASAMETSQPVIARLESGEAVPNLRTLERYCEALGVEATISFETLDS
jgi:transcriptional regulator with XRE-family HTH domain